MRVSWTVKQNQSGSYDIHKDGVLLLRKIPFEKLQSVMDPHHVRGENWKNLLRQLETNRQGTVVIDPWPPAKLNLTENPNGREITRSAFPNPEKVSYPWTKMGGRSLPVCDAWRVIAHNLSTELCR